MTPQKTKVADGAIRVATYSRDHQAVVNEDGTIDVYRRPSPHTTDGATDRSRTAFENINRRNAAFWQKRNGVPQ
jgi:hypothetical protein